MLDQKDLQAIREMMKEEIAESEKRMDTKLSKSENLILEEVERTRKILEKEMDERFVQVDKRFDKIDQRLDSMQHDINACKLEKRTLDILIRKIDQLERRIEELERKSA